MSTKLTIPIYSHPPLRTISQLHHKTPSVHHKGTITHKPHTQIVRIHRISRNGNDIGEMHTYAQSAMDAQHRHAFCSCVLGLYFLPQPMKRASMAAADVKEIAHCKQGVRTEGKELTRNRGGEAQSERATKPCAKLA